VVVREAVTFIGPEHDHSYITANGRDATINLSVAEVIKRLRLTLCHF
jgi:hypothetical protein